MKEVIFVNFKTYPRGTGREGVEMAKICAEVAKEKRLLVVPVVQAADIYRVGEALGDGVEVWAQHVDGVRWGQNTGWILPEAVKNEGAAGSFLNHSEHKLGERLKGAVERCQEIGLKTLVFAADIEELERVIVLGSTMVAYEPPELIGSQTDSVAGRAEVVREAVAVCQKKGVSLIVGAGIHAVEDVRVALACGATGIAVARDIMEADEPKSELARLAEGFVGRN